MAETSLEERLDSLEKKNEELEHEVKRLQAAREIENLVNVYEYKLQGGCFEGIMDMFAKKTPGLRVEIFPWGVYEGIEGMKRLYLNFHPEGMGDSKKGMRPGLMFISGLTTPVIEVAKDGKTAKGLWTCTGHQTLRMHDIQSMEDEGGKLQANWSWSKRAYDFVKEDGEWKIWHYHVYGIFVCPYEKSWVEMGDPLRGLNLPELPDDQKADRPTTYHWIYTPKAKVEYVPPAPEPYEKWDDSIAYP